MKLSAIVNLFDGEELLEGALKQVRSHVDCIVVVWQNFSNSGEFYEEIEPVVHKLEASGLVDIAIKYEPDLKISPRENELIKRKTGVKIALSNECTHFLFIDADEYYDTQEFGKAKSQVEEGNYDSSFCRMQGYYKEPIYMLCPMEGLHVPFIHKLSSHTELFHKKHHRKHKIPIDPTRATFPIGKSKVFDFETIVMHHYTLVRKDIARKLRNSSAKNDIEHSTEELVETFHKFDPSRPYDNLILKVGHHVEIVHNAFGISFD